MPPSFWRPVNFHGLSLDAPETLLETVRLGIQVYYHGLLIHLHLPYVHRMKGHHSNSTQVDNGPAMRTQHELPNHLCQRQP